MAAPPLFNSFDGGVNGNTIASTDIGSGNPWDGVTIGASSTVTYSNTHAHSDGLGMALVEPATGVVSNVFWSALGSITASVYVRIYCYLPALPNVLAYIIGYRDNINGNSAGLRIATNGTISVDNAAFGQINTGVKVVPINEWFRIEMRVLASTTVGEVEWKLFSSVSPGDGFDGVTPTETINSAATQVLAANTDRVEFGIVQTGAPTSQTFYYDDIAVSSSRWIGPLSPPADRSFNPLPFQAQGRNL